MRSIRHADPRARNRSGVTLIELLVALVVLGIAFGVVGLSLAGGRPVVPPSSAGATVRSLRARAIATGAPKTIVLGDSTGGVLVTAYPDGRVLGSVSALDHLAGAVEEGHAQ